MRLWKLALVAQRIVNTRLLGGVPGASTSTAWDLENRPGTNGAIQSRDGRDVLIDFDICRILYTGSTCGGHEVEHLRQLTDPGVIERSKRASASS